MEKEKKPKMLVLEHTFINFPLCGNATEGRKPIEHQPILLSSYLKCRLQIPGVWDFLAGRAVCFKLTYLIADSHRFHSNCFDVLKQLHEKTRYWCLRECVVHLILSCCSVQCKILHFILLALKAEGKLKHIAFFKVCGTSFRVLFFSFSYVDSCLAYLVTGHHDKHRCASF